MNHKVLLFVSLIVAVGACKTAQPPLQTISYEEDLSVYREVPSLDTSDGNIDEAENQDILPGSPPPAGHLRYELDSVVNIIVRRNIEKEYWDGFTIQVYSGLSRETAYAARSKMRSLKPELDTKIEYRQPSYRVKCGAYLDQLEAHKVHQELLVNFPNALLLPEKIKLDVTASDQ